MAALTGGRVVKGDPEAPVTGVAHDTRNVERGDLFAAIVGERLDGHRFLQEAARRGAKAALVSKPVRRAKIDQVLVKDTTKALGQLGRAQRLQWNGPVVAVTGSVGKTTVKDMAAYLLAGSYRVLKTEGNLNNQFGLPLTLLKLRSDHRAAVVELGINHPGEMEWLSEIARPDVAIVTAIGEAHLGFFGGKRQLAAEKLKIASALRPGGIKVLNADDPYLKERGKNVMTFGMKWGQVRAEKLEPEGLGTGFTLKAEGEAVATHLNLLGNHNVLNSLAAVSAGLTLGIPLKKMAKRLKGFVSQSPMRMEVSHFNGILFINDAYNASPTSMEAALVTLESLKGPSRKMAVLGDMLELGAFAKETHRRILRRALDGHLDQLVLVGDQMGEALSGLGMEEGFRIHSFREASEARPFVRKWAEKGDAVLLKASRGVKLERILEGF